MTTATQTVTATLVRGRYHDAAGHVFDRDKPDTVTQVVSPEVEEYLREHGVEITHHDGVEYRKPRFAFSNDAPKAAPAERQRRRVAAA